MRGCPDIRTVVAASLLWIAFAHGASATGVEPAKDLRIDPAPCVAAAAANDDDRTIGLCGALVDNDKTDKTDRIKALIARATAYGRKDMTDRAIGDYSVALQLDPSLAGTFNARGELWRKKGDRPKALADFGAALKLNPDHFVARANYKSLALELERLGALKAVAGKPSFNCATARRAVEKAICANPELADLDREINAANIRSLGEIQNPREKRALQREQEDFIARRNTEFGRPGYNLQQEMKKRLQELNGVDGY
ncbi:MULTISPECIES: tetratricopeptide repeat protein [unclassified Bradyrhizobium]|jgi:tetratricopeptide (TPR) repeat protein|uniref:tetratricopeptide repeat protein n=1 Tax=unclassified Bradyrhizobium TaxID=2631580 RepID=UPI001FED8DFD|nr:MULTISPECIES: tetratricopeptide repeat protein [unclassified Bradyrhizobium]